MKWGRKVAAWLAIAVGVWRMVEPQLGIHLFPEVSSHFRSDLRMDALLWRAIVAFTMTEAKARDKLRLHRRFRPWLGMVALTIFSILSIRA